jgi:NAD(P)H-nitrite reductase large subunit
LIDIGTIKLIREGKITVHRGVDKYSGSRVNFECGEEAEFDSIVLATGFRPRVDEFLQDSNSAFDDEGTPLSTGKESSIPGLYFCGY